MPPIEHSCIIISKRRERNEASNSCYCVRYLLHFFRNVTRNVIVHRLDSNNLLSICLPLYFYISRCKFMKPHCVCLCVYVFFVRGRARLEQNSELMLKCSPIRGKINIQLPEQNIKFLHLPHHPDRLTINY